jgi:hypothetical protein
MVYSLQWSARESLGNIALLQEIDKLASRVDQLREPVTGSDVLQILQRRLLGAPPSPQAAADVAEAYAQVVTGVLRAQADTASGRQQAEEDGLRLRNRIREAYPFHPALIDLMCERWTSVDSFQRTRGALRLLASCLHIEDAEQQVARSPDAIKARVREMLEKRLAGHRAAVVWPVKSQDLPDEEPQFLVGYMPLEFAEQSKGEQEKWAKDILYKFGERPRKYRNGVGLAIPDKKQIESLRRAVRYLLAIEKVDENKRQHRLTQDQLEQLKERRRSEEASAESSFRRIYDSVWLPRIENGELNLEPVEVGGRPLQATAVHERIMELLTSSGTPKVHGSVTPQKIVDRVKLGEQIGEGEGPRMCVRAGEVRDAFFSFVSPPRLNHLSALRTAIVCGVGAGLFAWYSGPPPLLGTDGKLQVNRERVTLGTAPSEDEIDFDSGYLIVPAALPEAQRPPSIPGVINEPPIIAEPSGAGSLSQNQPAAGQRRTAFSMKFSATRHQIFKAFEALANLADGSDQGELTIQIEATKAAGYDPTWLRNAVEEPLDEADVERKN